MTPEIHMCRMINADGSGTQVALAAKFEIMDVLRKCVDGWVEVLRIPEFKSVMIMDEEGKLKGKGQNFKASLIAGCSIVGIIVLIPNEIWENYNE